jgi:hypothetical protein
MRYRGGGIGHKYMRAIEEVYENMSRKRTHHKERKRAPSDKDMMDEHEPEAFTQSQANQHTHPGGQHGMSEPAGTTDGHRVSGGNGGGDGGDGGNTDGNEDEEDYEDDDEDYAPGSDSDSSEVSDSDDVIFEDSDESYGFGDF